MEKYDKLKLQAFYCYIVCLERLNHFNYIKNIIKIICARLSSKSPQINKLCTKAVFDLMEHKANHTQELKLFAVQELSKQLKTRPHILFQPNILECLGLHNIIIKKEDALMMSEETQNIEKLKKEVRKKFRKGKFKDARDQKVEIIKELKEADAIGLDIEKTSGLNNKVIMEILGIYFDFMKNRVNSPLLRGVFLHLPNFTTHVNIEIVWDLLNVLREYVMGKHQNTSNLVTALLCCFQIITVGAGNAFNDVEEKDFTNCLYNTVMDITSIEDMLTFLKTINIALIQKRQYSTDLLMCIIKRLAMACLHSPDYYQCGVLLFIKKLITKYPSCKGVIDYTSVGTNEVVTKDDYKIITNEDPQILTTTHNLTIYHELIGLAQSSSNKYVEGLVKSILDERPLPDKLVNTSPLEICKQEYLAQK